MTVMVSFSSWQGVKMHGNRSLVTGVLKQRFGFEGFVVSDWNGHAQLPGCSEENCAAAVLAGIDMLMAPASWKGLFHNLLSQARSGEIPMERIDDAVRRILRVKAKLGMFDKDRPWEGRTEAIGAGAHRALAREAVRKSLVLLKNNGGVLPIKGSARVLVAGSGADDIGQQSGGWTLSWQGTGNVNGNFPNGESIYSALKQALARSGGQAELQVDGRYTAKPDVAVVVFGETPYAEMQGDVRTLEYQPADKQDLALLKKLRAAGIPVVAVFLSGRALWVNPELNASDAFVAAWLPGSEGGGVADVLIGDQSGKPRHDFSGKLSFSWPRSAAQTHLNFGQPNYDPLFAYGYGLAYADRQIVAPLPEESGVSAAEWNVDRYFVSGRTPAPWRFSLRQDAPGAVSMHVVDADGVQEAGRQFVWSGKSPAAVTIASSSAIDLARQANGELSLLIEYRVDQKHTAPVQLAMKCANAGCGATFDLTKVLESAATGQWRTAKVRLSSFREAGVDMANVTEPLVITTAGRLTLSLKTVRLTADPGGAVKLPPAASTAR
jgi:beta-glucosidase